MSESGPLSVVAVSATLHRPSKTEIVLDAVAEAVQRVAVGADAATTLIRIDLLDLAVPLAASLHGEHDDALDAARGAVGSADVLLVATPVYKGSYTGLLKLFVDTLDLGALAGVPVVLAANGGSAQHSLVIEHELRPLFGFFRAATVATGIYATPADIDRDGVTDALRATIEAAATEAITAACRRP